MFMGVAILLILLTIIGVSWALTCGVIKLICMCFGLVFTFKYATGIWLLLMLINGIYLKEQI